MVLVPPKQRPLLMKHPSTLPALFLSCLLATDMATAQSASVGTWSKVATPQGVKFKQLAVGSATEVWGLDTGGSPWKWTGSSWQKKAGLVSSLSAASDGTLWAADTSNPPRVLKFDVASNQWTSKLPAGMKQVAVVNATTIWGLDGSCTLNKLNGTKWEKQAKGCCVDQISVGGDGTLMSASTSRMGQLARWTGSHWENLPGRGVFVSVGDQTNAWALNSSNRVMRWDGSAWHAMGISLSNISAANDGTVWGLASDGSASKWDKSSRTLTVSPANKGYAVGGSCLPVSYSCADGNAGWLVCNAQGTWTYGGDCPPNTACVFWQPTLSPYCVPPGFQFP